MKSQKTVSSVYEIRVEGELGDMWASWFEGLTIRTESDRERDSTLTVLQGTIADQPALHAVLNQIRDLNLTLISVKKIALTDSGSQEDDRDGEEILCPPH